MSLIETRTLPGTRPARNRASRALTMICTRSIARRSATGRGEIGKNKRRPSRATARVAPTIHEAAVEPYIVGATARVALEGQVTLAVTLVYVILFVISILR